MMKIIDVVDYDIANYKKASMFIIFPYCSFKCGREECQNYALAHCEHLLVSASRLVEVFEENPLTKAVVCGGLEPMDSWEDLQQFIHTFRRSHADDIIIYTGYTEEELKDKLEWLSLYKNIIVKFGRYIPNQESHFDEILGVELSSPNQYAKAYNVMEGYC